MANHSTSLAAYDRTDRTLGQRRVLAVLGANGEPLTRHEIAGRGHIPLQSVCARINELVKSGDVTELRDTRDGRHLLTVSQSAFDSSVRTVGSTRDSSATDQTSGITRTVPSLTAGESFESGPLSTHTTIHYSKDGVTQTLRVRGDPWEIVDYTRDKFFPDVNPRDYDERFAAAKRVRDKC